MQLFLISLSINFFSIPLFPPCERALLRSFILNSFFSKSLQAVLIILLAELYLPDKILIEINFLKCLPNKIDVLRDIDIAFNKNINK